MKRSIVGSLLLLLVFVVGSVAARQWWSIPWSLGVPDDFFPRFALILSLILVNDFGLHGLLWFGLPGFYPRRYRALLDHFRDQRVPHFISSGLLAAGEELVFRGVILQGMLVAGYPGWSAVTVSAGVFALAHLARPPLLWWFAVMAFWEGVVFGLVYLHTGSLFLLMVLHGVHDAGGYAFFAWQRARR